MCRMVLVRSGQFGILAAGALLASSALSPAQERSAQAAYPRSMPAVMPVTTQTLPTQAPPPLMLSETATADEVRRAREDVQRIAAERERRRALVEEVDALYRQSQTRLAAALEKQLKGVVQEIERARNESQGIPDSRTSQAITMPAETVAPESTPVTQQAWTPSATGTTMVPGMVNTAARGPAVDPSVNAASANAAQTTTVNQPVVVDPQSNSPGWKKNFPILNKMMSDGSR